MMPTEFVSQALAILRDGSQFKWYVIPLFAFVVYVYAVEVERRNWDLVFAGLALWGMNWLNEILNALILHFSGRAPLWSVPGGTAYLILIGLNIEIMFMYAIIGVAFGKILPEDKRMKILGIPNRIMIAVVGAASCLFLGLLLNTVDVITWDWPWWDADTPWLIFLVGHLPYFLVSFWVYDMQSPKKQAISVGGLFIFDLILIIVFGIILGWI